MVDTARSPFPETMSRALEAPESRTIAGLEDLAREATDRVETFAREKPMAFGLWALGIGFVLGWRLKPW